MALAEWGSAVGQGVVPGSAPSATMRTAAATTSSYVASNHVNVAGASYLALLFKLTRTDTTSAQWYVEWSHDATTWYRSVNVSASGGTNTLTENSATISYSASLNWCDSFPVEAPYCRVSVKTTGGATADVLEVLATALYR